MIISYKNISILMFISSVFFLVGVNKLFSPIIFIFMFVFPIFIYDLIRNKKILLIQSFFILVSFIFFNIILSQNIFLYHKFGLYNEVFRHNFWLLYGVVFLTFISRVNNRKDFFDIINKSIFIILMIFILESSYRLMSVGGGNFYNFKFNSFLYPDSNFVALNLLSLYIFIDQFKSDILYGKIYKSILFVLIFFCFSRTVYIIFALYFFISFLNLSSAKNIEWVGRFLIVFVFMMIFLFLGEDLISYVENDGSVNTKIEIFDGFQYVFSMDNYNPVIGLGSGNLIDYIGRESHNIWGLSAEMGVLWLILIILILIKLISEKNFFWIGMVFLVSGLTAILPITYMTFYICLFSLIYVYNHIVE